MHKQMTPAFAIYPEYAKALGIVQETPGSFLCKYYRPDVSLTSGIFTLVIRPGLEAGPFCAPSKVEVSLPEQSTQSSALVSAVANCIQLTDKDAFMKSLADLPVYKNADLVNAIRSLVEAKR